MKCVPDGWAITIGSCGFVYGQEIHDRKNEAIHQFLGNTMLVDTWREARKLGYRCVRVYRRIDK